MSGRPVKPLTSAGQLTCPLPGRSGRKVGGNSRTSVSFDTYGALRGKSEV